MAAVQSQATAGIVRCVGRYVARHAAVAAWSSGCGLPRRSRNQSFLEAKATFLQQLLIATLYSYLFIMPLHIHHEVWWCKCSLSIPLSDLKRHVWNPSLNSIVSDDEATHAMSTLVFAACSRARFSQFTLAGFANLWKQLRNRAWKTMHIQADLGLSINTMLLTRQVAGFFRCRA